MPGQGSKTRWGGLVDGQLSPPGFFRVCQREGVFWLVDPEGGRFLSKGVNTVRFDQDRIQNTDRVPYADACRRKYGGESAWRAAAAARLVKWGFNTLGSWSDETVAAAGSVPLAVTPNLDLAMSFAWQANERSGGIHKQKFPDVFDPNFEIHIRQKAQNLCAARRMDWNVIGWFADNELRWGPDWRGTDELLTLFLNLPVAGSGRAAAIRFLQARYGDFEDFNAAWRTSARSWQELSVLAPIGQPYQRNPPYNRSAEDESVANRADPARGRFSSDCDAFAALVAARYFELTGAAIKAADPNHLLLGCRFAYPPPAAVIDAAARHLDVISFNCYERDANAVIDAYSVTGKPCLVGEFSFRAADSGLPNTRGAGPQVATQAERAACFRHYVTTALRHPAFIGYHWFEYADQPAEGRFDGENSNFGTVMIDDREYEDLIRVMTSVNAEAETLHGTGVHAPV